MTNFDKIGTDIRNAEGTNAAVLKAFKSCAGLRLERGLMAQASNETNLSDTTIKLYTVGGEIFAKLHAVNGEDFEDSALKVRTLINESRCKGEGYRAISGKELDGLISEWDGSKLSDLFVAVQDLRATDAPDTGKVKKSQLDVVLAALPHLTAEELATVAEHVASLTATKTFANV